MVLNGFWQVFLGGMLGPLLMELVKVAGRQSVSSYRDLGYWAAMAALFIIGGAVAALNGVDQVPVMRAVELGIAAPATLAGLASASARQDPSAAGWSGEIDLPKPGGPGGASTIGRIRSLLAW